ncbi:hypothetical protein [Pedobacter sp. B4-66]|uniref:hypothetical protein n=1 Tax=Pedobacter sp. B4-66 TaxID=2817280 RepID=UPI001BDB5980
MYFGSSPSSPSSVRPISFNDGINVAIFLLSARGFSAILVAGGELVVFATGIEGKGGESCCGCFATSGIVIVSGALFCTSAGGVFAGATELTLVFFFNLIYVSGGIVRQLG